MLLHLTALHNTGSSTPVRVKEDTDKIRFIPNFLLKDVLLLAVVAVISIFIVFNFPYLTTDHENIKEANPLIAPSHIKPEWYFLFAYTILRSIPSKLGGVVALAMSILILFLAPTNPLRKNSKHSPILKIKF
jgi:ubiquinol-cytochrome c reductase cytochrome b subunit